MNIDKIMVFFYTFLLKKKMVNSVTYMCIPLCYNWKYIKTTLW